MIAIAALHARHGQRYLLQDINLQLAPGITALLGPNGAGKSTLLQLCADGGRHQPGLQLQGQITLQQQPLRSWPLSALARRRAFLPQQHAHGGPLTVEDLLALAGWPHGQPAQWSTHTLFQEALTRWQLHDLLSQPCQQLSGGERQRAELARGWLQIRLCAQAENRLWLLDEPQNALDLPHQQQLQQQLKQEAALGCRILFSTHDLNFALRTAQHFLLLKNGRLQAQGGAQLLEDVALLRQVFDVSFDCLRHPRDGLPWLMPLASTESLS